MIGAWNQYGKEYLLVLMAVTTFAFAIPILFFPLRWARIMRWRIPEHIDLTVYFARCLGSFIVVLEALMLRAALTGQGIVTIFEVLLGISVFMVVLHVYGAVKKVQPFTETLEIGLYSALVVLTLLFYPVSP
jgi:hypothetical protein